MSAAAIRLIDSPGMAQAAMDPNGWLAEVITYLLTPRLLGPNRFCGRQAQTSGQLVRGEGLTWMRCLNVVPK